MGRGESGGTDVEINSCAKNLWVLLVVVGSSLTTMYPVDLFATPLPGKAGVSRKDHDVPSRSRRGAELDTCLKTQGQSGQISARRGSNRTLPDSLPVSNAESAGLQDESRGPVASPRWPSIAAQRHSVAVSLSQSPEPQG